MPMYTNAPAKPTAAATPSAPKLRRLRPAGMRSHGGASSLLRLSHASEGGRLPSSTALAGWAQRAAAAAVSAHGSSDVLTRFWPGIDPGLSIASES